MKVALITLHRVINYGSFLQTYATQKTIEKLGHESLIIDYYPARYTISARLSKIDKREETKNHNFLARIIIKLVLLSSYIFVYPAFHRHQRHMFKMTKRTYRKSEDFVKHPIIADVFCTGSDQVWNTEWNDGIDYPLYLKFVNNQKKVAYASSFGTNEIEAKYYDETKSLLSSYSHISVRESQGVEILKGMGISSDHVLDPTLLLSKEDWIKFAKKSKNKKPYVLAYILNRDKDLYRYARELSEKLGCKLVFITYNINDVIRNGKMEFAISPRKFVSLFANAKCIVTDSFHATSFSMNLQKDFYVKYPSNFSSRISSVLKEFNLESRKIENNESPLKNEQVSIDYTLITQRLELERVRCTNILKEIIEK